MAGHARSSVLALQIVIGVGGLVPVAAGLGGAIGGLSLVGDGAAPISADSHFRYLSGLLLAVGLIFWSTIPHIERRSTTIRLLTVIVVAGGLARLFGILVAGLPSPPMLFGLGMELVVTPLICLWQSRIAGRDRPT